LAELERLWTLPNSGEWVRTFAIITTEANQLVAQIHDRMPAIVARSVYVRWLGDEPDPHDLLRPYPSEEMRIWPISARVNKPENDDSSILEPINIELAM
jgi:putative SOS response-associated peptidase YedK